MLTIVWNPHGFHLTKVLEKGRKFNAGDYIAEILTPLSQWRSIEAAGNERKLLAHADNARPHTAKLLTQYFNENRMKLAPYPPHSPDLMPSDFDLFEYAKRCLAGLSFEDAGQILAAGEAVLEGIEKVSLQAVFLEWMDRLRKCIVTNGEYTESAQINVIEEWSFIWPILRCSCPGETPCISRPEEVSIYLTRRRCARMPAIFHRPSVSFPVPVMGIKECSLGIIYNIVLFVLKHEYFLVCSYSRIVSLSIYPIKFPSGDSCSLEY
jgi:hypothetical protein